MQYKPPKFPFLSNNFMEHLWYIPQRWRRETVSKTESLVPYPSVFWDVPRDIRAGSAWQSRRLHYPTYWGIRCPLGLGWWRWPRWWAPFLQNFSNDEQSSMKGVVWKEKLLRHLSNLAIKIHPWELGADATKVIAASFPKSKIACTNMSVAPQPKEGLKSHRQILLEDGPEGYAK